ncbi:MAG: hypothetical protein IT378_16680 [Sandaracinaceae bacterium]|nr:hypothetical protein [Sandaracinaceae bacterium]
MSELLGTAPMAGLRAAKAAELCTDLPLGAAARAWIDRGEPTPAAAIGALHRAGFHGEAVLVLAHALSEADAIWWGLVCSLAAHDARPDPDHCEVLDLLGDWTLSASPELEAEVRAVAERLELAPPAAWVAVAVSLARAPDEARASAHRLAVSYAIAAAVQLAAGVGPDADATNNVLAFLEKGFDIARGGDGGVDRLSPPMFPGQRRVPRPARPWLDSE